MKEMGILKLSKLTTEELIEIIRQKEFEIKNLRKELKNQRIIWSRYYRQVDWRKRNPEKTKEYSKKSREKRKNEGNK